MEIHLRKDEREIKGAEMSLPPGVTRWGAHSISRDKMVAFRAICLWGTRVVLILRYAENSQTFESGRCTWEMMHLEARNCVSVCQLFTFSRESFPRRLPSLAVQLPRLQWTNLYLPRATTLSYFVLLFSFDKKMSYFWAQNSPWYPLINNDSPREFLASETWTSPFLGVFG